jgi:hypothetical protein
MMMVYGVKQEWRRKRRETQEKREEGLFIHNEP